MVDTPETPPAKRGRKPAADKPAADKPVKAKPAKTVITP